MLVGFRSLDGAEKDLVRQCMQAVLDGSWIDDSEFQTRLGFEREELRAILTSWPLLDDADALVGLAINNCMNEVCHGIYISDRDWKARFTQSPEQIKATYTKWKAS